MRWFYKRKGFTLLELMIVVIIIGILATLALPRFVRAVRRARWAGAASTLSIIRSTQMRYYGEFGEFVTGTTGAGLDTDIDISAPWSIVDYANDTDGTTYLGKVGHTAESVDWTITDAGAIAPGQP